MHQQTPAIVHRDLKPSNVLLESRGDGGPYVSLCDFGSAKTVADSNDFSHSRCAVGTAAFIAPELQADGCRGSAKVDVYCFGVLLFQCVSHLSTKELLCVSGSTWEDEVRRNCLSNLVPGEIEKLICACLQRSPSDRPTFSKIRRRIANMIDRQAGNQGREREDIENIQSGPASNGLRRVLSIPRREPPPTQAALKQVLVPHGAVAIAPNCFCKATVCCVCCFCCFLGGRLSVQVVAVSPWSSDPACVVGTRGGGSSWVWVCHIKW